MDLDHARRRIMEAPDVPAISDVLLQALELAGRFDIAITEATYRIDELERHNRELRTQIADMRDSLRAGLRP